MRWLRQGNPPEPDPSRLTSVRIFTPELELVGELATTGQRVTDMLMRGIDLVLLPAGAEAVPDNWLTVSPAHVLLVIPPPLPRRPEWRTAVEQRRLLVRIDRFEVTGTAHISPEIDVDERLRNIQPFLPLTEASLSSGAGTDPELLDVVIVNLDASSEFHLAE